MYIFWCFSVIIVMNVNLTSMLNLSWQEFCRPACHDCCWYKCMAEFIVRPYLNKYWTLSAHISILKLFFIEGSSHLWWDCSSKSKALVRCRVVHSIQAYHGYPYVRCSYITLTPFPPPSGDFKSDFTHICTQDQKLYT